MRNSLILAILLTFTQKTAMPQSAGEGFNQALSRIEYVKKNRPVEDVYLHFDKPYYATGDTIWFKAIVTLNEQHWPSPLSEVLHVDLISPMDRIIQSIRLPLKEGMAHGDLALTDSLPAGKYRVRAYTRWMLNETNPAFFYRVISIASETQTRSPRQRNPANAMPAQDKPDIRWFPEGGQSLTGVETKIAFKATGKNGLGIKVRGVVTDNEGKEITRFQTAHLGMGFFYLKPEMGKTYSAKLSFGDGSAFTAALPPAVETGMTLSIDEAADSAIIHILSSDAWSKTHQGEEVILLIYSNGASSVTRVPLTAADMGFGIDKRQLHSGIARVTLFTTRGEPVSERLLFIRMPDQLRLAVNTDKQEYAKREKVVISLDAKDPANAPAQANFSVAVVNGDVISANEQDNILTHILLTSGIKGFVEQPDYYLARPGPDVDANLDILLLTQGYRHFVWKQLLREKLPPLTYKAEKFIQVQGFVQSPSGAPAKDEPVTLKDASGQGPELKVRTDSAGRFVFGNLDFTDTMHFIIAPASTLEHVIVSGYSAPPILPADPDGYGDDDSTMAPYVKIATLEHAGKGATGLLKPVIVRKTRQEEDYYTTSLAGAGHADQVIQASDFHGGGSLSEQLNGRLHGITFVQGMPVSNSNLVNIGSGGGATATPMLIVLDGEPMDTSSRLDEIPLSDVATVEVVSSGLASIYGMQGGRSVLVITTKSFTRDVEVGNSPDPHLLDVTLTGFYKARECYTPVYPAPLPGEKTRDLRTTLAWKPVVTTDKDGHASFECYNGDIEGTYRVVVEGLDKNGNPGRAVYTYRVR